MKLRQEKMRDGRIKLKVVRYYRKPDGKASCTTEKVLGFVDELEKTHEDPIAWGESVAAQMTEEYGSLNGTVLVSIPLNKRFKDAPQGEMRRRNLGFAAFSVLYHDLEMDRFWKDRKARRNFDFDVESVFRLLVYDRLLKPSSKKKAWEEKGFFFEKYDFTLDNIYDSLSFFSSYKEDFVRRADRAVTEKVGRDRTHFYYDVTNYYFEIDGNDEDVVDSSGDTLKRGMRKKGCSKEHRPAPIVQMGLFMDGNGIPVDYELYPGSMHDSKTFIAGIGHIREHMDEAHIIFVADKGIMGGGNIAELISNRQGYIMSNSVRGADKTFKEYVLDESGYDLYIDGEGQVEYMMKEQTVPRKIRISVRDPKTGKPTGRHVTRIINERQIVIWSRKYAERERRQRAKVLEKTMDLAGTTSESAEVLLFGARKYIKKTPVKGGEKMLPDGYVLEVDTDRVDEEEMFDGYYMISTNVAGIDMKNEEERERDPQSWKFFFEHGERECYWRRDNFLVLRKPMPASSILEQYHGLWRIEESFRVIKSDLKARPVHVSREDHIRAHFLICFSALVLMRVLQLKLGWKHSASVIQEELAKTCGSLIVQNYYVFDNGNEVLDDIGEATGLDFSRIYMSKGEIRKMIGETKK